MFSLLISPSGNPIVISQNDLSYPHFIMQGYEVEDKGTKKRMQDKADELTAELYGNDDYIPQGKNYYGNSTQRSPFAPFS